MRRSRCPSAVTGGQRRRPGTSPAMLPTEGKEAQAVCASLLVRIPPLMGFAKLRQIQSAFVCRKMQRFWLSRSSKHLNATVTTVRNICLYVGCSGLKSHISETGLLHRIKGTKFKCVPAAGSFLVQFYKYLGIILKDSSSRQWKCILDIITIS